MSIQYPTSFESVRSAVIAFMQSCDPHMLKLKDRQLLKAEIQRMSGGTSSLGTGLKDTGSQRHVDELGRLVIPKELRKTLGFDNGTYLEFFVDQDVIYVQKFNMAKCAFCGSEDALTEIKTKHICENCISELFESDEGEQ